MLLQYLQRLQIQFLHRLKWVCQHPHYQ